MNKSRYFGTDGIRGIVGGSVINPEFILRLGYTFGWILAKKKSICNRPKVVLGKDTRMSSYMLESALEAGLVSAGVDVFLAGALPTPAIAYLTRIFHLDAGVMISASHNPYMDNGIKFFSSSGIKFPIADENAIELALKNPINCVASENLGRVYRMEDAQIRYIEFCKNTFPQRLNLNDFKIVIDAAHGAAFNIAPCVFRELGAEVHTIGDSPNGLNINDGVGSLFTETLTKKVRTVGADLGIALDGDADRVQMVDCEGRLFNGDELLYAIIRERMEHSRIAGVVGTYMTNYGFEIQMQRLGIGFERTDIGDRFILECMQKNGWLYGGESSGHLLCLDCHTTGDGIIASLQVLIALCQSKLSLSEWLNDLFMYPQKIVNIPWSSKLDWKDHAGLANTQRIIESDLAGKGRIIIRNSGTEPKLRIMVEAESNDLVFSCTEKFSSYI